MDHPRRRRFMAPLVAATVLVASMPLSAMASHGGAARAQARPAALSPRLIVLGREGGNIRPLTVSISGDGTVTVTGAVTTPTPAPHLSKDALSGLLALAKAEGFFTMPARMIGHGLPDVGGRFITIHTASGVKSVHVRFVRNAAFDQLYAVLMATAGIYM